MGCLLCPWNVEKPWLLAGRATQAVERVPELGHFPVGEPASAFDLAGDAPNVLSKRLSGGRQVHEDAPLVIRIARPGDQTGRFEALEERGDGPGVHAQLRAELSNRARRTFEEFQHHQVLGKGEAQRLEKRLVHPDHPVGGTEPAPVTWRSRTSSRGPV
jgi:hypothetical protein